MHEFTGIGDAQAAWTMATSLSSGGGSGGHGSQPNFLPPVVSSQGTPVPSSHVPPSQSSHGGTPVPMTQQATPSLFGAPIHPQPTPTPGPTDFSSVSMSQIPGASSGTGKWVALLLVVFVLLGGAVGGGLWWWNSKKAIAAGPDPGPVTTDPNVGNPNVGNPNVGNPNVGTTIGTPVGLDPNTTRVGFEPNMLPVGVEPPTMVEVPVEATMDPVEVAMVETPSRMTGEEESNPAADRAVARGRAAIGNGNLAGAIDALREAQRLVGRTHSSLRPLRNAIAERGAREVGFKVVNQCSRRAVARSVLRRLHAPLSQGSRSRPLPRRPRPRRTRPVGRTCSRSEIRFSRDFGLLEH
jgi:hypothetical protein